MVTGGSDDGKRLCVVKYTQEELNEISRVIRYFELDMNKLSTVLYDAIMRSFATYEKDFIVTTPSRYCYLAHESFHFLKDDIGLPLEESDFYKSAGDLIQFLPVISLLARYGPSVPIFALFQMPISQLLDRFYAI